MNKSNEFRKLHNQEDILMLGNVWDVQSALIFEKQGYKAIGTSSAAIASSLGLEDGEQMSFEQLNSITKLITSKVSIPLTVDIEGGYSRDINQIIKNIITLYENGVVGINIEDSIVTDERKILETEEFCEIIKSIKSYFKQNDIKMFLNIRTDFYIMGLDNPLKETIARIKRYEEAGADGIFVPCIVEKGDIEEVVKRVSIPVNVMTMPNLPDFKTLKKCGVKRISMGPFIYNHVNDELNDSLTRIEKDQSFDSLFCE